MTAILLDEFEEGFTPTIGGSSSDWVMASKWTLCRIGKMVFASFDIDMDNWWRWYFANWWTAF